MKKLISAVLVLLALGAAAFFFLKMRRYLPERPRAAELAPAETILFAQFPNLRQTALRIPRSDLYQIWIEPDVQAFLEKPRRKSPWLRKWEDRFDELLRVAPGESFVALTSIKGPHPGFVAGFSFAGTRGSAREFAGHLREQFLPSGEMVSTLRSNWFLCASDAGLLAETLARFDGKPGPTLAASPVFQRSVAPLGVGQDLVLFGKPADLAGKLEILTQLRGKSEVADHEDVIAMATKIDGAKLRDTIFLRGNNSAQTGSRSQQTLLSLATPQTLLYYAADLDLLGPSSSSDLLKTIVPGFAGMEKRLAEKGLTWGDLPAAVGPQVGVIADWPEAAALPTLLIASEVREAVKAHTFIEALTGPLGSRGSWETEDHDGIPVMTAPNQGISLVRPTAALTDRFALLGMSPEAVIGVLPKSGIQKPSLGQTAVFQDVAHFIPEQAVAFAYLDFQRLFERVYRMARPFITLSLAFSAEAGAQLDAGKLPPVESVSKHLGATMLAQSKVEDGMVIESIGSVTLPELMLGVAIQGFAAGIPDFAKTVLPGGVKAILPQAKPASTPAGDTRKNAAAATSDSPLFEKTPAKHK